MTQQSYTMLPLLYDRFVALRKSDYSVWLRTVSEVRARHHLGSKVLSLAAGTCECELDLVRAGLSVTCTDLSPAMLDIARQKLSADPGLAGRVTLLQADMREVIPAPSPVDLVLCHYFAINYLLTYDDLGRCFTAARQALLPGGVLLLDCMHNEHFASQADTVTQRFIDTQDVTSLQETRYEADGTLQATLTVFYKENGVFHKASEVHRQRVYPLSLMERALREAGFTGVRCYRYGGEPDEPPRGADKRVVFEASRS